MYVLGLSCFYHDSSACLLKDGVVVAAAQEERFNRSKYSADFPIQSINYCLQEAGITIYDVEHVAFYEKMYLKFERTMLSHVIGYPLTMRNFLDTMPLWLKDRLAVEFVIREELSFKKDMWFVKHHQSHAASAFFASPFSEAAFLTVDGVGEYATTGYGHARDRAVEVRKEIRYPHSLGLLYSIVTAFLGFRVFSGEGKVMALAEYGQPNFLREFERLMTVREDGSFFIHGEYFSFNRGETMHNKRFEKLFGPPRTEGAELTQRHKDIAASLQRITEEVLLKMVRHVHRETGSENLCLAGGVFLNVTANNRIAAEGPFKAVYIQPAAGDAGSALGAAYFVHHCILQSPRTVRAMKSAALGPSYSEAAIETLLMNEGVPYERLPKESLLEKTADLLAEGGVVGWFQGRMEFGPRALGNRSILASPAEPGTQDYLNRQVKHRESFRPFGASVLMDRAAEFFSLKAESPFMLMVAEVLPAARKRIPAVTHINQTCRVQTLTRENDGIYYELVEKFLEKTGLPMVLNTSFNDDGEPIVCKPEEALRSFMKMKIDALAIGPFLVRKKHAEKCANSVRMK